MIAALRSNQNGKRKVVVIVRERDGNRVPAVFSNEGAGAVSSSSARVAKGTIVQRRRSRRHGTSCTTASK